MVQEDVGQGHHRTHRARLQGHLQAGPRGQHPDARRAALLRGRLLAQRHGGQHQGAGGGRGSQEKGYPPFNLNGLEAESTQIFLSAITFKWIHVKRLYRHCVDPFI